jgi:hypothetical protein
MFLGGNLSSVFVNWNTAWLETFKSALTGEDYDVRDWLWANGKLVSVVAGALNPIKWKNLMTSGNTYSDDKYMLLAQRLKIQGNRDWNDFSFAKRF